MMKAHGDLKRKAVRTGLRAVVRQEIPQAAGTQGIPALIRIVVDRRHAETMRAVVAATAGRRRGKGRTPEQSVMIVVRAAGSRTLRVARLTDRGCGNRSCLKR